MDQHVQLLVSEVQQRLKLDQYFLKRYNIFHEKGESKQAVYVLSMEWFPTEMVGNERGNDKQDLNPTGTVVVEIDFHNKTLYQLVFVGDVSHPQAKELFPSPKKAEVIDWVEETTGLTFGKQFMINYENKKEFRFSAAIDHIPVLPLGTIQVKFNSSGELTMFSIDGLFPTEDQVVWEPFSLLPKKVEHLFKQYLKLFEVPIEKDEKWLPVLGIAELYVRNRDEQTLEYPFLNKSVINLPLEWSSPLEEPFHKKEDIDLSTEVTLKQAIANETHPDQKPVTEAESKMVIEQAKDVMRREYPKESSKWLIHTIYRKNSYLIAELRPIQKSAKVISRKISVIISPTTLQAINYIDNNGLLEIFNEYTSSDNVIVSAEDAFNKLWDHITIKPVYVYHPNEDTYYLYGEIDSEYVINATTGETVYMRELE